MKYSAFVVEEIDETNLWLEVIKEAEIEITDEINHLIKESKEITDKKKTR